MAAPVWRRFTRAAPGALDVFAFATDDQSADAFFDILSQNQLLDILNDPNPAAGLRYQMDLWKGSRPTGLSYFSSGLDPGSGGRGAVGPVDISPGRLKFNVAQRLGALTAYSFQAKFAKLAQG